MKLRWPVAASLAPVGLLVGALIVGPPSSVPNDVRLIEAPPAEPVDDTDGTDEEVDSAGPVPSSVVAVTTTTVSSETTTTAASADTTTTTTTTVADLDAAARAEVFVVVANATAVSGVAGENATILNDAGFTNTQTTDAAPLPETVIYSKPGSEVAAGLVADALILPREIVQPYPGTTLTAFDDDADVIVLVGADRAG